jgi:hypothetical protein
LDYPQTKTYEQLRVVDEGNQPPADDRNKDGVCTVLLSLFLFLFLRKVSLMLPRLALNS